MGIGMSVNISAHGTPNGARSPNQSSLVLTPLSQRRRDAISSLLETFYMDADGIEHTVEDIAIRYPWYLKLLEARFAELPPQYMDVGDDEPGTESIDFTHFCTISASVCKEVSNRTHPSLETLTTALITTGLVTGKDDKATAIQQLVFAIIGTISMLYTPSPFYVDGKLKIRVPQSTPSRHRISDTWVITEQPLEDASGSVVDILRNFSTTRGPIPYIGDSMPQMNEVNTLVTSNLNYYTLSRLGGIKIGWVDSVCMHLELDRRDKTLMIFRHPSLCAILSQRPDKKIYLDRVFEDFFSSLKKDSGRLSPAGDFYREIILTYRLIFGQDKRSWQHCRKRGGVPDSSETTSDGDPLLHNLCCRNWENEAIYDEIDAPDVRSLYFAHQDFPFFGGRLMALQEYTRLLEPYDWRTLYYDRRNVNRFCIIWSAIVLGILTLILALLGLGLAGAQVAGSFTPQRC